MTALLSLKRLGPALMGMVNLNRNTGGGDQAPPGYGFLAVGSPSSYQVVYVGSTQADPRIAIPTGA